MAEAGPVLLLVAISFAAILINVVVSDRQLSELVFLSLSHIHVGPLLTTDQYWNLWSLCGRLVLLCNTIHGRSWTATY